MHALIYVRRMRTIDWLELSALRDRHHWLGLGGNGASMHLRRRKESLNVVFLDHGATMNGHTDDAGNTTLLFIDTDVKSAISTRNH